MADYRIREHPILPIPAGSEVEFFWQGHSLGSRAGEMIASALFANGVRTFGRHPKDGAPQGIFCANGQCAQCTVMADGLPVKACMTPVAPGMRVEPLSGLPVLPDARPADTAAPASASTNDRSSQAPAAKVNERPSLPAAAGTNERPAPAIHRRRPVETLEVECLILGGGPAGLSAAIELGKAGVRTLLVDDKHRLGGKLVLQTHKFFGSIDACHAGTRGIDIASKLAREVMQFENVRVWLNTTALAVFSDRKVGVLREGRYVIIQPQVLLTATGAREKSLVFPGNTLPGVYGAGAFQTLVNRDLVRASDRLFIVGGGNVGLIAGYHALQAGIAVAGLCEALPECGGYKVHRDKLARMGVPILTSHTVVSANGRDEVESVTIAKIDASWNPIPGTERAFDCDTILVAVGLDPVDEFHRKAGEFGLPVYAAGDAEEIAEASAAMFMGRIRGLEIAAALGRDVGEVPPEWHRTADVLKSRPGATVTEDIPEEESGVFPVFHCAQEIPCNPCISICPNHAIRMEGDEIMGLPEFTGDDCIACEQCVAICPGLAVTLVDYREDPANPIVTIPFEYSEWRVGARGAMSQTDSESPPGTGGGEFEEPARRPDLSGQPDQGTGRPDLSSQPDRGAASGRIKPGDVVTVLDTEGAILGNVEVIKVRSPRFADRALLVRVRAPREIARRIAGIRVQEPWAQAQVEEKTGRLEDDAIVCRCERISAREIRTLIRSGVRDMNQLKAATRAGMGACGGKTCPNLILRLFHEEGVNLDGVTRNTRRPLFMEVPLGAFAGVAAGEGPAEDAPVRHATGAHEGGL